MPLLLLLVIAWEDVKTRRIPNLYTFAGALAGLCYHWGCNGWAGLSDGLLGLALGLVLLLLPYALGGMGAGDVKTMAAMGAWLGPRLTFHLFLYTGLAGGLIIVGVLVRRGELLVKLRRAWIFLLNWVLSRPAGAGPPPPPTPRSNDYRVPYGLALALGMVALAWLGPFGG